MALRYGRRESGDNIRESFGPDLRNIRDLLERRELPTKGLTTIEDTPGYGDPNVSLVWNLDGIPDLENALTVDEFTMVRTRPVLLMCSIPKRNPSTTQTVLILEDSPAPEPSLRLTRPTPGRTTEVNC
jgi:hypothetical protein